MKRKYYGAIDIGTNAGRMLIGYVVNDNGHKIVKQVQLVRVPLRLGEDVFDTGYISEEKLKRFILTLKAFKFLAKAYHINKIMACATSAMREAINSQYVISRIFEKTKIKLEVIDGEREAELIFKSFNIEGFMEGNPFLFIDVGGGSTELTLFSNGKKQNSKSFKIGTLRMLKNKIKESVWDEITDWINKNVIKCNGIAAIGTGGNINKISQLARKRYLEPVTLIEIEETLKYLKSFSLQERINDLRMKPDRADVIVPATEIYINIMKMAGITEIYVPKMGLTDGMILEQNQSQLK